MANRQNIFLLKRSNIPGKVPSPGDINLGEVALNTADVILYASGTTSNSILPIGWDRISRTGDTVTGNYNIFGDVSISGSSLPGGFALSVTGDSNFVGDSYISNDLFVSGNTIIQNGLTAGTIYTDYIDFNTGATSTSKVGRLIWNNADEIGGLEVTMRGGNVTLQIGEENVARVYNADSVPLTDGMVVYVYGSQGNTISVKRASSTTEATSARVLGVVTETIAVGGRGFVNTFGLVRNLNTSAYSGGTPLWLGTTSGTYTSTKPIGPQHAVLIGFVSRVSATVGSIFIHISNGWELDELHDVRISGTTTGDLLMRSTYNGSGVWVNTKTLNGSYTITGDTTINNNLYVGNTITATTIGSTANCVNDLYVGIIHGCSPISIYDPIRYSGATVSGVGSFSFGIQTSATTDASHAEGYQTKASGNASHAEGNITTASGLASHAEGDTTTASGSFSHAQGSFTIASGTYSHAEGQNTTASNSSSHAGGYLTIASGLYSHAEGQNTIANNQSSHAEGSGTTASGLYSHAEGRRTIALGNQSHAEGYLTISSGSSSHAEGYLTTASGDGSHAEGYATTASGLYSHAEGYNNKVIGIGSHAEGSNTTASGNFSHSEGGNTTASGYQSHAEGYFTTATGNQSHAEGESTTASGQASHAEGYLTIAPGLYSHAEGWLTTAIGQASHADGRLTIANGNQSHSEGVFTTANGNYSHSEGQSTTAIGQASHAEGYNTTAQSNASHTEGYYTTAIGNNSHAEGLYTIASGSSSHAEGYYTIAKGIGSHAEGSGTTASGSYSHTEGLGTVANGNYQHVQGLWNLTNSTAQGAFIIGNGTGNLNRSNLFFAASNNVNITGNFNVTGDTFMSGDFCMNNMNSTGQTGTNCLDTTLIPTGVTVVHQFQGESGVLAHIGDLATGEPNSRGYTYFENNLTNTTFTASGTGVYTPVIGAPTTFAPYNNLFTVVTGATTATIHKMTYNYPPASGATSATYLKFTVSLTIQNAQNQALTFQVRRNRNGVYSFLPIGMSITPQSNTIQGLTFNGIADAWSSDFFQVVVKNDTGSNPANSIRVVDMSFSMFT